MTYVLDTNVFLEAANTYYAFDIGRGFWDWLCTQGASGHVHSVDEVLQELQAKDDECSQWASGHRPFFVEKDVATLAAYANLSKTLYSSGKYKSQQVSHFLARADAHLIAHAAANGHQLVTRETSDPRCRKVKIPDVANLVGVKCVQPFQLYRSRGLDLRHHQVGAGGQKSLPQTLSCCGGKP